MPKNTFGGSGHKRVKKVDRNRVGTFNKETDYYATVKEILGHNQIRVKFHDGREVQVSIPGRMHRKVWVRKEDVICCSEDEIKWKVVDRTELTVAKKMMDSFANVEENEDFGLKEGDEEEFDFDTI